jgi:hypothetical protein
MPAGMETQGQYLAARPPYLQRSPMWQATDTICTFPRKTTKVGLRNLSVTFLAILFGLMSMPIVYFIAIVHHLQSLLTTVWQKLLIDTKTKIVVVMTKEDGLNIPPEILVRETYLIGMLKEIDKSIKELQTEHKILHLELINLQLEMLRRAKGE